ncbi:MAG: hypothetical protein Q9166_006653 [cf. Caloplaca sp. 2 TL-2023]
MVPYVRLPPNSPDFINYVLNAGAGGIVMPHVQNVAQAEAFVRMAKFPPLGDRSYPPMALFGKQTRTQPGKTVYDIWNQHAAVFCQIEDMEGVKNVEEIAKVSGVDALMVGAGDLRCSLGLEVGSQDGDEPSFLAALDKIQRAADKNGLAVLGFAMTPGILRRRLDLGWRAFIVHADGSGIFNSGVQAFRSNVEFAESLQQSRKTVTGVNGHSSKLLRAYRSALLPHSSQYKTIVQCIRAEHIQSVQAYVKSPAIARELVQDILADCGQILDVLDSVHVINTVTSDSLNCVISAGEKLACRFMSGVLQDQGVPSEFVDLSQAFTFPLDQIINQQFYDELARSMGQIVKESHATVPVVTGYFGNIPGGLLARIGRGYTDLCASLLTIGLEAKELQVWKEVEGFYTADPRRVPNAKLLSSISPEEASELTFNGSEIIHFLAMGQAVRSKVPIKVKNVMNPSGAGTLVRPESKLERIEVIHTFERTVDHSKSHSRVQRPQLAKGPAAMTSKHNIVVVNVFSQVRSLRPSFFMDIVAVLGRWQLEIDLVCTSQVQMSMAIHSQAPPIIDAGDDDFAITNPDLRGAIEQLREIGTVNVLSRMAVISLVGRKMRCSSGTAGRVFTVLGDNDVNIEMIAQGASEISISCVVEEREVDRAMNLLHTSLFAD